MAEPPPEGARRVRVTLASGTRRADLALPGGVHVADLLPELARHAGLLDVATVHGGYRLATLDGRRLAADAGLVSQGVEDGSVILVDPDDDDATPRRHDDVAEAMADVVGGLPRWNAATGRRGAEGVALLLLLAGAGALLSQPTSSRAGLAAVGTALALTVAAGGLSRLGGDTALAVGVAWTGCAHAGVAGFLLRLDGSDIGTPVAAAGGGLLVAGLAAALGLPQRRDLVLPSVLVGAVLLTAGALSRALRADPAVVLTAGLAVVVLAGGSVPGVALAATGGHADVPAHDVTGVDVARLVAVVAQAHRIVGAVSVTVGLLLVLVAPVSVSLGPAGAVVTMLSCAVVLLRCRRHVSSDAVLVGLASGVLGLLSVTVSMLWLQPTWRPVVAVTLLASASALLVSGAARGGTSARVGRLADLLEGAALAGLLPALVLASGVAALAG